MVSWRQFLLGRWVFHQSRSSCILQLAVPPGWKREEMLVLRGRAIGFMYPVISAKDLREIGQIL